MDCAGRQCNSGERCLEKRKTVLVKEK
jgi:hypothetical protein